MSAILPTPFPDSIKRPMTWQNRIETKPEVLAGKPVVTGTRIPVELVVELPAQDWSTEEILDQYPALTREDKACLNHTSGA